MTRLSSLSRSTFNRGALGLCVLGMLLAAAPVEARVYGDVSIGIGGGAYGPGYGRGYYDRGYGPGWGYPPGWAYGGYYPGYYPPPVAYVPPPQVVYVQPTAPVYAAPPPVYAPPAVDQTSPTYMTPQGQTCREYQSNGTINGASQPTYGTACLQPDGSWRVVP